MGEHDFFSDGIYIYIDTIYELYVHICTVYNEPSCKLYIMNYKWCTVIQPSLPGFCHELREI